MRILGTSPDSIDLAEDRQRFSQLLWELAFRSRRAARPRRATKRGEVAAEHRLPGRRPAVLRARRPRHGHRLRHGHARSLHDRRRRRVARPSGADRQVPRRCVRVRRRRSGRRRRCVSSSAASWSTSRRPAFTRATAPAWCRRSSWPERHLDTIREYTRRIAKRAEGRRADERAVRNQRRCRVRARSESAGVADGSLSIEGHRRAAGEGCRAGHGRAVAGRPRADAGSRGLGRVRQEPRSSRLSASRASTPFSDPR